MFTGLIERVGGLRAIARAGGGHRLAVEHEPWESPLESGESVAVQGVCLTVTEVERGGFRCDVLDETLAVTTLKSARAGSRVNLERALAFGGRLGGHLVTGHVDGLGHVRAVRRAGHDWVVTIAGDATVLRGIVHKGSIAVDGVSLTVSAVMDDAFEVNIIPHTWTHTTLAATRVGEAVNLETDVIGKYVSRFLEGRFGGGGVTFDTLRAAGIA